MRYVVYFCTLELCGASLRIWLVEIRYPPESPDCLGGHMDDRVPSFSVVFIRNRHGLHFLSPSIGTFKAPLIKASAQVAFLVIATDSDDNCTSPCAEAPCLLGIVRLRARQTAFPVGQLHASMRSCPYSTLRAVFQPRSEPVGPVATARISNT